MDFGTYLKWSKPDTTQVLVHIRESKDEDENEEVYEQEEDLECNDSRGSPSCDCDAHECDSACEL